MEDITEKEGSSKYVSQVASKSEDIHSDCCLFNFHLICPCMLLGRCSPTAVVIQMLGLAVGLACS